MKVKPFYIRITCDMTSETVQGVFDKCHRLGAIVSDNDSAENFRNWSYFGVCGRDGTYLSDSCHCYFGAQEITLDQLDEWLGIDKTETQEEKEVFDSMAEPCPTSDDCPYGQIRQLGDQLHNILCGLQDEPIADELSNVVSKLWDVRKPETPQQREDRERLEAIEKMCEEVDRLPHGEAFAAMAILYDAGYRKAK